MPTIVRKMPRTTINRIGRRTEWNGLPNKGHTGGGDLERTCGWYIRPVPNGPVGALRRPHYRRPLSLPVGRPGPHDLAEDRELADVIGVVGARHPDLAEDGMPWRV